MNSFENYRKLTKKELEVLKLLAKGYLIKEMADIFGIRVNAVECRITGLRRKLGVPSHIGSIAILPILALNTENLVPYVNRRNPPTKLTERQREVLHYLTSGLKQSEAAKAMQISKKSIQSHLEAVRKHISRKLGRRKVTLVDLTHYAIAHRITPLQFTEKGIYNHRTLALAAG